MSTTNKFGAGDALPSIKLSKVGGGDMDIAAVNGWRLLVAYRGKHCPLCKKYLKTLNAMLADFEAAGISVMAVSADTQVKAEADVASEGWSFPVGYGLTLEQMKSLGLYISEPRSDAETDRPFAEPGLFAINPQGQVQIVDISNAPFARPDLATVLMGIKFIADKGYPIRGTLA